MIDGAGAAIPLAGAAISVLGALYVARTQRAFSRQMVGFESQVGDVVLRRQLCLALASKARVVAERASEASRAMNSLHATDAATLRAETLRRAERLDSVCDAFVDSWAEVTSRDLADFGLVRHVSSLADALEIARLGMIVKPLDPRRHAASLREVSALARVCQHMSVETADGLRVRLAPSRQA